MLCLAHIIQFERSGETKRWHNFVNSDNAILTTDS